ncbi:MAG: hypothetical protein NC313_09435 [Butyrivibrio sp.]|nr:hypothetical protein [Butyrivibrio sp.]
MNNLVKFRKSDSTAYLSDEELQKLIADTESEPLLRPPKGFRDEILERIDRKRQYKKNMQLFSYSVKVIAATAAAVAVLLFVPDNIEPEKTAQDREKYLSEQQEREKSYVENPAWQLDRKINEYYDMLNDRLNQLLRMEVDFDEKEKK